MLLQQRFVVLSFVFFSLVAGNNSENATVTEPLMSNSSDSLEQYVMQKLSGAAKSTKDLLNDSYHLFFDVFDSVKPKRFGKPKHITNHKHRHGHHFPRSVRQYEQFGHKRTTRQPKSTTVTDQSEYGQPKSTAVTDESEYGQPKSTTVNDESEYAILGSTTIDPDPVFEYVVSTDESVSLVSFFVFFRVKSKC